MLNSCSRIQKQVRVRFFTSFFEKFPVSAINGRLQRVFTGASWQRRQSAAVQRELPMRKKSPINIKAAMRLIAAENLNALRGFFRNIANFVSKPTYLNKKT